MSPRVTLQRRIRAPRRLRLGPFRVWSARLPGAPALGFGRIATTDTPGAPAPGQRAHDENGWVLVIGGRAFAALRRRSVPVPETRP